jgi:sterol desaturase/sphingolipid hydroxylase (fatty acid hydroxylase superfamily)
MDPMTWSLPVWIAVAWAFFGTMPWLIDRAFSRWYPDHQIDPETRASLVQRSRTDRPWAFVATHVVNATIFGVCLWAGTALQRAGVGNLRPGMPEGITWLLVPLEVLLVLLVFDTQFFWVHWLAHQSNWVYKHFHREHHLDHHPDTWSAAYQHPVDLFVTTAVPMAWAVVLPIHAWSWWLALLIANYINIAGHSGYEVTRKLPAVLTLNGLLSYLDPMRRYGSGLVQTVMHHDLHHQRFRVNYALYFTHWDRLMGTLAWDTDRRYRAASGLPRLSGLAPAEAHTWWDTSRPDGPGGASGRKG